MSRTLTSLALAAAACACRAAPPAPPRAPLRLPDLTVRESLAPGDLLSGSALPLSHEGPAVAYACRILYLERRCDGDLAPIEESCTIVADLFGDAPVLPVAQLAAGGRLGTGEIADAWLALVQAGAAGRVSELVDARPVLLPSSTYLATATGEERVEDPLDWLDEFPDRGPIPRGVAIAVSRGVDGERIALVIDDLDPLAEAELRAASLERDAPMPGPPPPAHEEAVRREACVVGAAPEVGERLVATLPSPFDAGEGRWFAFVLERLEGEPEAERVAAAREELARASAEHAAAIAPASRDEHAALLWRTALESLRDGAGPQALLVVAAKEDAPLAQELALVAGADALAELSAAVLEGSAAGGGARDASDGARERGATSEIGTPSEAGATSASSAASDSGATSDGGAAPRTSDASGFGWRLERAAWQLVCQRAMAEDPDPTFQAALVRHAGALALFPDVVLDAVAASRDASALRARLAEEQRTFLEDPDPALRVRAHDWLAERGLAVEGYDPLAEASERKAALERAAAAEGSR